MKNILIIGGAGYIGTALTKKHSSIGDFVYVLDDMSNPLFIHKDSQQTYPSNVKFIEGDISTILFHFSDINFDVIYHLASESRPTKFSEKYSDIIHSNITGILRIIGYIRDNKIENSCRLVYASTSEVYGEGQGSLREDDTLSLNPIYERNCYSISKIMAENILQNEKGLNWNIVRFFNVYGGQFDISDTKVIPTLKRCVENDDTFEICGDGNQTRSFTYIDDIVDGLLLTATTEHYHEIFNLGLDSQITINDLVSLVKIYYPELKVKYVDGRAGEPRYRLPDNTKAYEMLWWTPKITIEQGIESIFA